MTPDEYDDLWMSVRVVQNVLRRCYAIDGFNVGVQDGKSAGQSVPHVHVHVLPRTMTRGSLEPMDELLDLDWAPSPTESIQREGMTNTTMDGNVYGKDRTIQEMVDEADGYRRLLNNR